ncbi:zinc finger, CCHC-type containing protein [Tanacetum coccineum]
MTNGESMKDMTSKFDKLEKFEGQDFRRWQKKMHFLLTTLKVVYVLSTPSPVWSENETLEATRKRMKWGSVDYICKSKYMAEDASAKKFLVSNFMNYKMVDTRPVMEQYHEMLRILGQYTQHNLMMDEAISVAVIIDKLPPSWKEFKHGLRNQELDNNPKGKNQIGSSSVNMVEGDGAKNSKNNKNKRKFKSGDDKFANKKATVTCWKCNKTGHMKKDCRSRKGNGGAGSNGSKDPEKQQVCKSIEDGSFVKMGNVAIEPIKGIGRVLLTFTSGKTLCLDNVLTGSFVGLVMYVMVNSIIESRDVIFDEDRFTSIPRPRGMIQPSSSKIAKDEVEGTADVPGPSVLRKSTRTRKAKSFGSDFQLYLVEGTRDKTLSQREYCFIIEEDPRTLSEAMASRDVAFWKEAVQSEIDSIMHNDIWELIASWMQSIRIQKEGIDFFDTYAPVARISTIRLLLALAAIHDLVIHQMDVKTAFLNGDLDEEIYMKQPKGFVMPRHESKVCKLKKSLYGLKQWHQKFDDVVLSNGFSLNQVDKYVYSKFDASGKGVIICFYVDDILIFGTDQYQVNKTKEFLSSNFDMKDLGGAEVIIGIRIKRGNNVSQLEYSRAIGCLMYAMISTRPDIAFAVGKLSRYTSNPSVLHWQALGRVFQYLKGTMDYGLTYSGYPSVIEGGAISWASKKQTCITSSTIESEFVALTEAEWLRNLVYEIPLWPKPMSTISIRCDSAATLAKAYSQVYNGKSRHLGVRHSMIRELIMNGVISVEFVRTQLNLADHLTKGLARDLVRKAAIGMGLKST